MLTGRYINQHNKVTDMNTITSDSSTTLNSLKQPLSKGKASEEPLEHMKYVERQLASTPKMLEEEKVTISEEALAMFRQDASKTSESKSTEGSANDKLIEQIKEQIENIKQQLSRIKHDKSEEAEQQRRQLQMQLNTLNATMLDLLGKKLDAI